VTGSGPGKRGRRDGRGGCVLFTATEIAREVRGWLVGDGGAAVTGVSVDSREVGPGDLFVAIRGERTDGHLYVRDAFERGAAAALVERRDSKAPPRGRAVVVVEDSLRAMGELAAAHRRRHDVVMVGITGSVGKTTTKDMAAAALSTRWTTLKTFENYNTEIGLPLTLFELEPRHEAAVVEMGMRGPGQVGWLARIAAPLVGVVTNVEPVHLELLGSLEEIAAAKAELVKALPRDGTAVLNAASPALREAAAGLECRVVYFGDDPAATVRAEDVSADGGGVAFTLVVEGERTAVHLPVPGRHNVENALAAAAAAWSLGLEPEAIARGIESFSPTGMRMQIVNASGIVIIDDTYNASPVSTRAALSALLDVAGGRTVAVLGDMLELGAYAVEGHREVGREAARLGVDVLVAAGDLAREAAREAVRSGMEEDAVHVCDDNEDAARAVAALVRDGDTVLVKGSRGSHMEVVVRRLRALRACDGPAGESRPEGGGGPG